MSEPLARLYDLALRALDDHEHRADALRGRLGPTLAAAALGVTLLSGPLLGGAHPVTVAGKLALVVALGGLAVIVVAAFRILGARHRPFAAIEPRRLTAELVNDPRLDDVRSFYTEMIDRLASVHGDQAEALVKSEQTFTAMLWGILVMLCGLAVAAVVG